MLSKIHPALLSLLSGLLFFAAWPVMPLTPLIFVAWLPVLQLAEQPHRIRYFLWALLAMFIWNATTTWWIWNSTAAGAVGAIIANSFLMALPLWGYHIIKGRFGRRVGYLAFIAFWLGFEYIHLNWQLSWPWLTLGNVFAMHPLWVQWYQWVGSSGGSLWVLIINVLIFDLLRTYQQQRSTPSAHVQKRVRNLSLALAAAIAVPLGTSYALLATTGTGSANGQPSANVIIVQPNIDPYNEKFVAGSTDAIIQKMIAQSERSLDTNTRLVVWPETALPVAVWQDQAMANIYYQPVVDFIGRHPNITLVTGIETFKNYGIEKATITARQNPIDGTYFDAFNASIALKNGQPPQFYNKSKLVPGVETLPDFMLWLGPIFEKFGGTTGGYGKDKEANIFELEGNPYVSAPIICYESIYGEYIASFVRKGANLLTIMTNDGWWANTAGHKQHLHYARLHAIETQKWIARSANTGISAVINNHGDLLETRGWDEAAIIKYPIPALAGQTFFVRHGDVLSRAALIIMVALLVWNGWVYVEQKRKKRARA